MDIALKLKRAVATLAAGALFVSSAGVAMAQTFNDVPTDAWYYDYVEQLVDDGVIDVADNYRPADALNRAELVKIAITAIDGLAGYEAPATPTFDDVPADAWFFDFVEAAVQLGIVNGYTDASGNLTGYFGPGDTVNRAAATKILVNAFSVPTDLDPASIFPDVKSSDWFYDYVVTAYNQSVLDGYDNGYFGPADAVTRAQVAKLVVNAQNPVERVAGGEGEGEGEGEPTSEGDLEVSLNDDTAASSTLPLSANGVALASFDVTADQDDVYVSQLVVTRGGVGQADDWENLYLYDGAQRLTTGRTVNNDTNTATFPLKLTVDAGTTTTLTLVGDVSATALASNQHYFYIASAANVTSNAQSVAGDFPVAGNTFTMGSVSVNTVTVAPGTAPSKVTIGESDAEVASVKLTAGAQNDIALHQLALTNGGSLSSDKLVNLRLLRGTDEVATADGFVGDVVTFVLDTPYVIDEGQTKTFYVNADIDGGRSTDNIILYLDENTDVIAVDQQYGFGAAVTNNFTQGLANMVALEGGDVTVVDNGPAATQIAQNATNIELLNFSMTAARDLTVRDTFLQIDIQDPTGVGPSLPATGSGVADSGDTSAICMDIGTTGALPTVGDMLQVTAQSGTVYVMAATVTVAACGTAGDATITSNLAAGDGLTAGSAITEVDPYDYVKNVKLVDLDSGSTLAGPMTDANAGANVVAGPPSSYNKVHTEDYELTGGETRHLSVQADLDQNMASGYQVRAQVRYSATGSLSTDPSYIKDLAANEFVVVSNVIGAGATALAGDYMITAENSLTVSLASTPTSQDYVKGSTDVPSLGVALAAGDAGDIVMKRMNVRLYADSNDNFSDNAGVGAVAASLTDQTITYTADTVGSAGNSITMTLVETGAADLGGNNATIAVTAVGNAITVTFQDDSNASPESVGQQDIVECVNSATSTTTTGNGVNPGNGVACTITNDVTALITATGGTAATDAVALATTPLAGGIDGAALTNNYGDVAADTLVSSVTLYDGNDVVAGPESISIVDTGAVGFTAGSDYYRAQFDDLNMVIPAGSTKTLTVKVNLLNTATATRYLALDVAPADDIISEDDDANTITPSSATANLNLAASPSPKVTILTSGDLTASSEGNPDEDVLVTGSTEQLVSKYRFHALDEDFQVKKLTIVNDDATTTANFGDDPVLSSAVSRVVIKYPDVNGVTKSAEASLSGTGQAKFAGLDFYVPAGEDAFLEVYVNVNTKALVGESISGKKLRLGLQNTGNSITTFEAIGQSSSTNLNFTGAPSTKVSNSASINNFVVRNSVPTFANVSSSTSLSNGERDLMKFSVTADSAGAVSLARLVFDVTLGDANSANLDIGDFKFYRESTLLTNVNIYGAAAGDVDYVAAADLGGDDQVIVSFDQEETIPAGSSITYKLSGTAVGVETDDSIDTKLNIGDESEEVGYGTGETAILTTGCSVDPASTGNGNTGRIADTVANCALFGTTTDVVDTLGTNRSIVWSDKSADNHGYPTVAGGATNPSTFATGTGSYDWTNGYLLDLTSLTSNTLKN